MELTATIASASLLGAVLCFLTATALAILEVPAGPAMRGFLPCCSWQRASLLETLYLHYQGGMRGRCPITTLPEILIFLSWSTVLLYFMVGPAYRLSLLGVFTAPLVAIFTATGLATGAVSKFPPCRSLGRPMAGDPCLGLAHLLRCLHPRRRRRHHVSGAKPAA